MKLKCLLTGHSWIEYYFNCQRSCSICNRVESAGMSGDDDDWYKTTDHEAKRALRWFVIKLLGVKDVS